MTRALVLAVALLASCSFHFEATWERVNSAEFVDPQGAYRMEIPVGWARNGGILTRDGYALQSIVLGKGEPRQFVSTAPPALAPPDFVKWFLDGLRQELAAKPGVEVLDSAPVTLAECPGFRLHMREEPKGDIFALFDTLPQHVRRETLLYFIARGERIYVFTYEAPALYYFERDLPTFERLVQSFELLEPEGHPGP